jgi:hypothetical protein
MAALAEGRAAKRRRCDAPGESESLGVGQSVGGRVRLEEPLRGKSLQAVQGMLEWMYRCVQCWVAIFVSSHQVWTQDCDLRTKSIFPMRPVCMGRESGCP